MIIGVTSKILNLFKIGLLDRAFYADYFYIMVFYCKTFPWRDICSQNLNWLHRRKKGGSVKCHVTVPLESDVTAYVATLRMCRLRTALLLSVRDWESVERRIWKALLLSRDI